MSFLQMRPAWSPDGRRLAAWSMNEQAPGMRDLIVVDLQDRRERVVTSLPLSAVDALYSLVRRVPGFDRTLLRQYVALLRSQAERFKPEERFRLQRIEGLERLASL